MDQQPPNQSGQQIPQVVTTAKQMLNSGAISATQYAALLAKIGWPNENQLIAPQQQAMPPVPPGGQQT